MYVIKPEIHVQEEIKGIHFFGTLFDQNQPFFKVFKNTIKKKNTKINHFSKFSRTQFFVQIN
jgi:hypothetical protein